MSGHRRCFPLAIVLLCLGAVLIHSRGAWATTPVPVAAAQEPEGVTFNASTGTYTVHRVPKRALEEVMKSFALWHHQVLADESTVDYSAEDGILSMECSACGLTRPSAIDIATIDLDSVVAYEAGVWHLGGRSKDGTQDFFGLLRGEIGPEPHDPTRAGEDRRVALVALVDLFDLAYLTQNPKTTPAAANSNKVAPVAAAAPRQKSNATSLETLAANGDVEGVQALQRTKGNTREVSHALETAYGNRARTQMLDGKVDEALQTLSAARQKFGKSVPLRDQEAHYVVIGDAYDRLRLAVKLDIDALRNLLERIRGLESNDVSSIERMLAGVLSNRIADQRAAGRQPLADGLLTSGRELFPAWAEQLTQGAPGVLQVDDGER
jgi:hypothetical protein